MYMMKLYYGGGVMPLHVSSTTMTTTTNFIIDYERDNEWKSHKCGINI